MLNPLLKNHYERVACFPEQTGKVHEDTALSFLNRFTSWVWKREGFKVSFMGQGSAFEGLKVRKPDEFDFLLVILTTRTLKRLQRKAKPIYDEIETMAATVNPVLKCYTPLLIKTKEKYSHPIFEAMTEIWPNSELKCLSARAAIETFQKYILEFQKDWTIGNLEIPHVVRMEPSRPGNPALTTVLHLDDGTSISIDMSIAVRQLNKGGSRHYIAKNKPILHQGDYDNRTLLWLESYQEYEMNNIRMKTEQARINYRTVKSLLLDVIGNSYIPKTFFMSWEHIPDDPTVFLSQMLRSLEGSYHAELERRNLTPTTGHFVGGLLLTKFNRDENILARYSDEKIKLQFSVIEGLNAKKMSNCRACLKQFLQFLFKENSEEETDTHLQNLEMVWKLSPNCPNCYITLPPTKPMEQLEPTAPMMDNYPNVADPLLNHIIDIQDTTDELDTPRNSKTLGLYPNILPYFEPFAMQNEPYVCDFHPEHKSLPTWDACNACINSV